MQFNEDEMIDNFTLGINKGADRRRKKVANAERERESERGRERE